MKRIVWLILLVILTSSSYAQQNKYKSGALLWKISGKDLKKPSYLLGTFHLKPGEFFDSIPGAKAALESCEQVIGELTMTDVSGLQSRMLQAMMMPSDTTYKMFYSDSDYEYINNELRSTLGAGLDQVSNMRPAAIQLMILMAEYQKYFPNMDPNNVLDVFIQTFASKNQKIILGLEGIDDQIYAMFGSMQLQRQADLLLCYLKNADDLMQDLSDQIEAYNQGNLNKLYNDFIDKTIPCLATQEELNVMNKNRNDAWMHKLPALMKEKTSFIAVGALHLAGPEGLINQLEKAGYKVDAVK